MTTREAINVCRFLLDADDYPNGEQSKTYKYNEEAINMAIDALKWHKTTEEMPTIEGQYLCCKIAHNGAPRFDVYGYVKDLSKIHYRWCGAGFYGCDIEDFFKETPDYWKEIGWAENEL